MVNMQLLAKCFGAVLLASCANAPAALPLGPPPAGLIEIGHLPVEPAHEPQYSAGADSSMAWTEVEQVAIDHVVRRLNANGLDVVDLGATILTTEPDRTAVRVVVIHVDGFGSEQLSLYDVELIRGLVASWTVASTQAVQ